MGRIFHVIAVRALLATLRRELPVRWGGLAAMAAPGGLPPGVRAEGFPSPAPLRVTCPGDSCYDAPLDILPHVEEGPGGACVLTEVMYSTKPTKSWPVTLQDQRTDVQPPAEEWGPFSDIAVILRREGITFTDLARLCAMRWIFAARSFEGDAYSAIGEYHVYEGFLDPWDGDVTMRDEYFNGAACATCCVAFNAEQVKAEAPGVRAWSDGAAISDEAGSRAWREHLYQTAAAARAGTTR